MGAHFGSYLTANFYSGKTVNAVGIQITGKAIQDGEVNWLKIILANLILHNTNSIIRDFQSATDLSSLIGSNPPDS